MDLNIGINFALAKSVHFLALDLANLAFLQRLDELRDRVFKMGKERAVVTDLICQCLTQSMRSFDKAILNKLFFNLFIYLII